MKHLKIFKDLNLEYSKKIKMLYKANVQIDSGDNQNS